MTPAKVALLVSAFMFVVQVVCGGSTLHVLFTYACTAFVAWMYYDLKTLPLQKANVLLRDAHDSTGR